MKTVEDDCWLHSSGIMKNERFVHQEMAIHRLQWSLYIVPIKYNLLDYWDYVRNHELIKNSYVMLIVT